MSKQVFFHLGMPKTGSTYLQQVVFPRLKNIHYFGKRKLKDSREIINSIKDDHPILFSHELDLRLEQHLKRISTDNPDARVILVFREHKSWINSKYRYYIRKHGYLKFDEYIDLINDQGFLKKHQLSYKARIELVEKYFNKGPFLLIFGDLQKDPQNFTQQITDLLGVELDESAPIRKNVKRNLNEKQLKVVRRYNRYTHYKKLETGNRFINRVHYKFYEFLLHIVAFLGRFFPNSWIDPEPLIPKEGPQRVGDYFREDWNFVLNYKAKNEQHFESAQ